MPESLWNRCLRVLEGELPEQQFNTWVRPLQAVERDGELKLLAPNRYVIEWLGQNLLPRIKELILAFAEGLAPEVALDVGTRAGVIVQAPAAALRDDGASAAARARKLAPVVLGSRINAEFTFDSFVEGKSNQLAKAAAIQVAGNPGRAYNPLFIYGGVGLGKTHLMHAVANKLKERNAEARLAYVHSERFVGDMVRALQHNTINDFKAAYRSLDCLMIDDIQFFAGKDRSQEEFFHTFNALLESQQQVILTCDRYPKEVDKLEPRLKSRLGWGLSVAIEPPDFETRAAILLAKAHDKGVLVSENVAMLLAKRIRSNVRDLEGALNTLAARANFYGKPITTDFAEETLRDLLATHAQAVTVPNIQKIVAEYFGVRLQDLLSKRRVRSLARPRQIAMALSKELTEHSLPEIGEAFGGRDHTTVLHACRTIRKLCETDTRMRQDWEQLIRTLTG